MPLELQKKLGEKEPFITKEETEKLNKIDSIVVISGTPIVNAEKASKLRSYFLKMLKDMGPIVNNEIFIPLNPTTGESTGVIFIEFENPLSVQKVIAKFNNHRMDKAHTLHVYSYREVDDAMSSDSVAEEPQESTYEPLVNIEKRPTTLWSWLNDELGNEQFAIRYAKETEICKTTLSEPAVIYAGDREKQTGKVWCDNKIEWSPQGTYLVTFHAQGVVLWGGEEWSKLLRFEHAGVTNILFSPKERFLITWNGKTGEENMDAICIWDVRTGKLLRKMPCSDPEWPSYKFSYDEKYFATKGKDSIAVYEFNTNSNSYFTQLDRKLIPAAGIRQFDWSPIKNYIVYWSEERQNKPGSAYILEIPSKQIIQSSSVASVKSMEFKWHNEGRYLALYIKKYTKNRKNFNHQFNIFRMTEKFIPVETFTVNGDIVDYGFEGCGSRFAVAYKTDDKKSAINFYDMEANKKNKEITFLYTLPDKLLNHIYWCPTGKVLLIAGIGVWNNTFSGTIEWFNVDTKRSIAVNSHFSCNGIAWDYSGRFVSTYVVSNDSNAKYHYDNGFILWNAIGNQICKVDKQCFLSFQWRPYPALGLTAEDKADINKNMKKYTNKYKILAKRTEQLVNIKETRERLRLIDEFRARREALKPVLEDIHKKRQVLGIKEDSDDDYELFYQTVETVISTKEEIIS